MLFIPWRARRYSTPRLLLGEARQAASGPIIASAALCRAAGKGRPLSRAARSSRFHASESRHAAAAVRG